MVRVFVVVVLGAFVAGMVTLFAVYYGVEPDGVEPASPDMGTSYSGAASGDASGANLNSPYELPAATAEWDSASSLDCPSTDLRILVVAGDGEEATLPLIRQTLAYMGTPFAVWVADQDPGELTSDKLSSGCRGFYQGIILTNGEEVRGRLANEEQQALRDYEAKFGVRQLIWYTYPTPEYGLENPSGVDTTGRPIEAWYTDAGENVFPYANASNPLKIQNAYAYPAQPLSDGNTTPLLADADGNVLAATREHDDGTESLALTFDSNQSLQHGMVLSYGLINWVTKGLFLGERQYYVSAQVDDLFLPNALYGSGEKYRIGGEDLQAVLDWQKNQQAQPSTEQFRLDMSFNAYGTTGVYEPDTLTAAAERHKDEFKWISHTYKHLNWNDVDYETAEQELADNDAWAQSANLKDYDAVNLISPEYTGLENLEAMRAAYDAGVRYVVGDSSRPQYENPSPNAGLYHPLGPSILVIPRRPNNIGFDASTPKQELAGYNDRYRDTWGRDLTYDEMVDKESDVLLSVLLKGDEDPWMFHQANLRAYDGTNTLVGDVLGRVFRKYSDLLTPPILSPRMDELGQRMSDRMGYNDAGVMASVVPGRSVTLTAQKAAKVPVTGLRTEEADSYGGQYLAHVDLGAGESLTLPLE